MYPTGWIRCKGRKGFLYKKSIKNRSKGARVKHPAKFLRMSVIGTTGGGKIGLCNGMGNLGNIFYTSWYEAQSNPEKITVRTRERVLKLLLNYLRLIKDNNKF